MIQRVQTIYLILAEILLTAMFFLPLAQMITPEGESFVLTWNGIQSSESQLVLNAYPLAILLSAILILNMVIIFLYKNRVMQMRICIYNILLMAGALVMIWFYSYQAGKEFQVEKFFKIPALFPIMAAFLTFLAFRSIRKDELLIKSIDRIR